MFFFTYLYIKTSSLQATQSKDLCDSAMCQDAHADSWGLQLEKLLCDSAMFQDAHTDSWGLQLQKLVGTLVHAKKIEMFNL